MTFKVRPRPDEKNQAADLIQDRVRLNVEIDRETMHRLKVRAAERRTTIAELVRRWVDEYLNT